jgi:hypothetical protein
VPERVNQAGVDRVNPLRRDLEIFQQVLASDLGNGDQRIRLGGIARHQETMTEAVHERRRFGHGIPIHAVTHPGGLAVRPQRNRILRIEQHIDAVLANGLGHLDLVPIQDRAALQQHLAHALDALVRAQAAAIAKQQQDFVLAIELDHRAHDFARVHLHAAVVLVEMTQHDA